MRRSNLSNARLDGANLSDADLGGANLAGAIMKKAILKNSDLSGKELIGRIGNLQEAKDMRVDRVKLSDADSTNTESESLKEMALGADLQGADWRGAELAGAIMGIDPTDYFLGDHKSNVNLSGADFREATGLDEIKLFKGIWAYAGKKPRGLDDFPDKLKKELEKNLKAADKKQAD